MPIFSNFEGEARGEKTQFFGQIFQKVPKNAFLDSFFFQNFACLVTKTVSFKCFGRAQKINLVELKTRSSKFSIFCLKIRSPLEKILDPPLHYTIFLLLKSDMQSGTKTEVSEITILRYLIFADWP